MHGRLYRLAPGALCLLMALGCADTAHQLKLLATRPFNKTAEEVYGIKTPKDRVEDFRKMAKHAKQQTPEEQQKTVDLLCREFRGESNGWVQREILRALSEFPQPAAGDVLVHALEDTDPLTRRTACTGLGKRGDEIAVRELVRVLGSETNDDVRMEAAVALGTTGNKAALAPLSEALAGADPAMQTQAQQALVEISGHDFGTNVQAWREYAQTGHSDAAEISFAEKLRRMFY